MKVLESIVVAFSMYSKIPMPHIEWNKENMKNVLCFFPWVGAVAGVLVWLWFRVSDQLGFGVMLRASVAVLSPVLVIRRHPPGRIAGYGRCVKFLADPGAQAGDPEGFPRGSICPSLCAVAIS